LVKIYFSNFSRQNPTLPAARDMHFQTKDSSQAINNLLVETAWRWIWSVVILWRSPSFFRWNMFYIWKMFISR